MMDAAAVAAARGSLPELDDADISAPILSTSPTSGKLALRSERPTFSGRPANGKPFICTRATLASSAFRNCQNDEITQKQLTISHCNTL